MKEHIHHFVENAHSTDLPRYNEVWSFNCKRCLLYVWICRRGGFWRVKSYGCTKCGWEPLGKMTSIMRSNRMRNHRKRAHGR